MAGLHITDIETGARHRMSDCSALDPVETYSQCYGSVARRVEAMRRLPARCR